MYLTSHRVTDPGTGETGIHAFLHHHGRALKVDPSWDWPQVSRIANEDPGVLADRIIHLQPGGNRVLSFLEVICEDSTAPETIDAALIHFESHPQINTVVYRDGVIIYFSLAWGWSQAGRESFEVALLAEKIVQLVRRNLPARKEAS